MLSPEGNDPEFFESINGFLAQQKEDKELADLEATAEIVTGLFSADWEGIREDVMQLAKLWTVRPDFNPIRVSRDQAVKYSPGLAAKNKTVLDLIDKVGYATEGIYRIAEANKRKTHIPRSASLRYVSTPLPIDSISLTQFNEDGLRYFPDVAEALGIQTADGSFTRISIDGVASAFTDRQTRTAMEQILLRCPRAPQSLTAGINTEYYVFGDRIGKVVHRPAPLLIGRALDSVLPDSALSEFTAGDEFMARIAFTALKEKLSSLT